MFVILCCRSLLVAVHTLTAYSLVEVYKVAVELWAVNARKECLAAYRYSASTAHTCAIHHQGVERYGGLETPRLGGEAYKLHHNHRTDADALVILATLDLYQLLHKACYHTLEALSAVVGGDVYVCDFLHLLDVDKHSLSL